MLVGLALVLWNPWRPRDVSVTEKFAPYPATKMEPNAAPSAASPVTVSPLGRTVPSSLGKDLNRPEGTIQSDLQILVALFAEYRAVLNEVPIGPNREITNAMIGGNRLFYTALSPNHPAINADGPLCDRWGSPYHFHDDSKQHFQIRSAGPDRVLWTKDDALSP